MRPCSSDGAPTSGRKTAPTTSSRSRPLTSSRRCLVPLVRQVLIRVERFLRGAELLGDVLKIDANAGPRAVTAAQGVDERVGRLQVRRRFGVPGLPALE